MKEANELAEIWDNFRNDFWFSYYEDLKRDIEGEKLIKKIKKIKLKHYRDEGVLFWHLKAKINALKNQLMDSDERNDKLTAKLKSK